MVFKRGGGPEEPQDPKSKRLTAT